MMLWPCESQTAMPSIRPGRADRDDDRVRSPGADRESLHGADREAEQQRQDDRGGEAEAERVEEDHRGDRGGLPEGEREEVAAEDDDREADGDDPDERRRREDRLPVAHGQEAGGREGSVDRHRREDRDPDGKGDVGDPERPAFDADAGHHGAHDAAPVLEAWLVVMSARIAEADASARGTTETIRP